MCVQHSCDLRPRAHTSPRSIQQRTPPSLALPPAAVPLVHRTLVLGCLGLPCLGRAVSGAATHPRQTARSAAQPRELHQPQVRGGTLSVGSERSRESVASPEVCMGGLSNASGERDALMRCAPAGFNRPLSASTKWLTILACKGGVKTTVNGSHSRKVPRRWTRLAILQIGSYTGLGKNSQPRPQNTTQQIRGLHCQPLKHTLFQRGVSAAQPDAVAPLRVGNPVAGSNS